jgi:hypothetical protein
MKVKSPAFLVDFQNFDGSMVAIKTLDSNGRNANI